MKKEREVWLPPFDLLCPDKKPASRLILIFWTVLWRQMFSQTCGDDVIVWSNGQENEHFLRFNFPHNCWKETKLSAVNIGGYCVKWVHVVPPQGLFFSLCIGHHLFFFFLTLTLATALSHVRQPFCFFSPDVRNLFPRYHNIFPCCFLIVWRWGGDVDWGCVMC